MDREVSQHVDPFQVRSVSVVPENFVAVKEFELQYHWRPIVHRRYILIGAMYVILPNSCPEKVRGFILTFRFLRNADVHPPFAFAQPVGPI